MSHHQKRKAQVRYEETHCVKMCDQTRQKENRLPCPAPYVTEVMFYDIHPDSDTHQLEVLSPLSGASIWNSATGSRTKIRQTRVDSDSQSSQIHVIFIHITKLWGWGGAPSATCGQKLERLERLRDITEKTGRKRKAV